MPVQKAICKSQSAQQFEGILSVQVFKLRSLSTFVSCRTMSAMRDSRFRTKTPSHNLSKLNATPKAQHNLGTKVVAFLPSVAKMSTSEPKKFHAVLCRLFHHAVAGQDEIEKEVCAMYHPWKLKKSVNTVSGSGAKFPLQHIRNRRDRSTRASDDHCEQESACKHSSSHRSALAGGHPCHMPSWTQNKSEQPQQ